MHLSLFAYRNFRKYILCNKNGPVFIIVVCKKIYETTLKSESDFMITLYDDS